MKVNALIKDYIINSRIKYSQDIKENIVWFNNDNLKPYIETCQIIESGKIRASYNRKKMHNGDTFEVFNTSYASLQAYKNKDGRNSKILLKDFKDKSKRPVTEEAIDSFKSALTFINKDLFGNL